MELPVSVHEEDGWWVRQPPERRIDQRELAVREIRRDVGEGHVALNENLLDDLEVRQAQDHERCEPSVPSIGEIDPANRPDAPKPVAAGDFGADPELLRAKFGERRGALEIRERSTRWYFPATPGGAGDDGSTACSHDAVRARAARMFPEESKHGGARPHVSQASRDIGAPGDTSPRDLREKGGDFPAEVHSGRATSAP